MNKKSVSISFRCVCTPTILSFVIYNSIGIIQKLGKYLIKLETNLGYTQIQGNIKRFNSVFLTML